MCVDDHLYKNVLEYVRKHGAYSAETFDIEEWYLEKMYFGDHAEKYKEFDR